MKKALFIICAVLAIFGCGGDNVDELPCFACDLCGSQRFDPSTESCSEGTVYSKCSGKNYNPSTHFCSGNLIYSKCGGSDYNLSTQYCSNGTLKAYSGAVDYAGQTYKTQVIGTQTWMAENLNYNATGSKCYNNDPANCDKYGRLYDWTTAMLACSSGWHLPTQAEWDTLSSYVQSNSGCSNCDARLLKTTAGWNSSGNGIDQYGFSALPGGDGYGHWWSASESNSGSAYYRDLHYDYEDMSWSNDSKSNQYSVRCLQDNPSSSSGGRSSSSGEEQCVYPPGDPRCEGGQSSSSSRQSSSSSAVLSSSSFAVVSNCSADFRTVPIGTQVWAAENLNCDVAGSVCYNNDPANCDKYGRLYNWSTAMDLPSSCNSNSCSGQIGSPHKGICPNGWHIPSNDDWDKLYRFADGTSGTESPYGSPTAGTKLKSQTGWNSSAGRDAYGFSALPGGLGYSDGSFYNVGDSGRWWSASEYDSGLAYIRIMYYNHKDADWNDIFKSNLFSVRCLQD